MITLVPDDNVLSQMITLPRWKHLIPDDNISSQMKTFSPRW
jgi:hypothetical protein